MFQRACSLYWACLCDVGGASVTAEAELFGKGCFLTPNRVITAYHIVKRALEQASWPVVLGGLALWKAAEVFSSPEHDLAILELTDHLEDADLEKPSAFPALANGQPFAGKQLGYLATFRRRYEAGDERSHTYFASGFLSFFVQDAPLHSAWVLSGGFIEQGFSGGPVFDQKGEFVGVVVRSMQWTLADQGKVPMVVTVPVVSCIYPCVREIQLALTEHAT